MPSPKITAKQQPQVLISLYLELHRNKYGKAPVVNRFKEKWAFQDVIDSVGYERARQLLEYYFETSVPGHPLMNFYYSFDKMDEALTARDADRSYRLQLMEETRKRFEES